MAEEEHKASRGLFRSLVRVGESMVTLLHHRAELFAVELQEWLRQLMFDFVIICLVVFCFVGSTILGTIAVILYACPPEDRLLWTVLFAVFYALGALVGLLALRGRLKSRGNPFPETLTELEKDKRWLQPRK